MDPRENYRHVYPMGCAERASSGARSRLAGEASPWSGGLDRYSNFRAFDHPSPSALELSNGDSVFAPRQMVFW